MISLRRPGEGRIRPADEAGIDFRGHPILSREAGERMAAAAIDHVNIERLMLVLGGFDQRAKVGNAARLAGRSSVSWKNNSLARIPSWRYRLLS
jgi:hypothetical protein